MSLLTRCSQCAAVYQVQDEQLRVSDGWVRCGQCGNVFKALDQALDAVVLEHAVSPAPTPPQHPAADDGAAQEWPPVAAPSSQALETEATLVPQDAPEAAPPGPEATGSSADLSATDLPPAEPTASTEPMLRKESAPEPPPLRSEEPAPNLFTAHDQTELRAARPARWQSTGTRAMLAMACVVLMVVALMQWLYRDRDRLASLYPEMKPALQWLCKSLDCKVSAMRSPEAVVIDGSAFTMAGKDSYRLNFVVRNQSAMTVAVPHIELTLTDSLERVQVRRVLTPAELGAPSDVLAAHAQWPLSVALQVKLEQAHVLGYRLLAFYP